MTGQTVAHYHITAKLGEGGMGAVYLAHDSRLDRRVAIKVLPTHLASDEVARERFRREAMAAAALDHPFICKIFEIGEEKGTLFIIMEYISGETLFHRLRGGPLPLADALRIAGEVAEALEEAHSHRFVHRDLKPANVMLTQQGRAKVMDFGLAKRFGLDRIEEDSVTYTVARPGLTEHGTIIGTPDYMSPEQMRGEPLDSRSDLFSFGILLHEIVTGAHPFRRPTASDTMSAILRDPPDLAATTANVPSAVVSVIRKLLAKVPNDRYQSMSDVRADLRRIDETSAAPAESPTSAIPLIGREQERAELLRHLDDALAGRGSVVLIGGEPGIGKTHLTGAILSEARRRGAFCLVGACYEMEGAPPYVPFIEMLEYSARVVTRETFRSVLGEAGSEVARLMPELRRMFPDIPPAIELPPEQQRRFFFNAYREFVERSAAVMPMVVLFEDLHWADEPTLLLLQHLAQTVATARVLMIGTYRDVELEVTRPFAKTLEGLLRQKLAARMSLRRLPVAGVEKMLAAMSGLAPPPSLPRVVFEATEGNPFFVEEVFRHLAEEGKLFDEHGAWRQGLRVDQLEVPEGVRLVIGRRLERLNEEARRVLTTAAVIGRTFSLRLLEEIETARPDAALDAVEEAERARLVTAEPSGREARYRFVHELVRQTLAETLSLPRRQRLHARIAIAAERVYASNLDAQASTLAHHLYQAGAAADAQKAVHYLSLAAARASAAAAHEEALAHIDNAFSLIEDERSAQAVELHVRRAAVLRSLNRLAEAVTAYEKALALFEAAGDVTRFVETCMPLSYVHGWGLRFDKARALEARARRLMGSGGDDRASQIVNVWALSASAAGEIDAALPLMPELRRLAASPDANLSGFAWLSEAHVRYHAFQLGLGEEACRNAISKFRITGDLWGEVDAEYVRVFAAFFRGQLGEMEKLIADALPRAERIGHQNSAWCCRYGAVSLHLARGHLDVAERAGRDTVAYGESSQMAWNFVGELILGNILFLCDRVGEATERVRRAMNPEPPQNHWTGYAQACLAWIMAMTDAPGALELLRDRFSHLPRTGRYPTLGTRFSLLKVLDGLAAL